MSVAPHERDDWDQHWSEYAESAAENPAQDFRRRLILRLCLRSDLSRSVRDQHVVAADGLAPREPEPE